MPLDPNTLKAFVCDLESHNVYLETVERYAAGHRCPICDRGLFLRANVCEELVDQMTVETLEAAAVSEVTDE